MGRTNRIAWKMESKEEIDHYPKTHEGQLKWCYIYLGKTSRSFAAVIQALGPTLKDAVCIFYLALRALDTIEDDTSFPKDRKLPLLRNFHTFLYQKGWNFTECGENPDERTLVSHFDNVIEVFMRLDPKFQEVIADITKRMGHGMAEFIEREVITIADWDLYCYYVAGLVGIGLSNLFAASGLEDSEFREMDDISNSMGLCLQKTNIIRDYREDIDQSRMFWPREIWSKYAEKLEDFKDPARAADAVRCLNELVTNAMQHLPDCLVYMGKLKDPSIFNFCAIPQVMAVATMSLCYNNHDVFTSVVKMKREDTEKIIASIVLTGKKALYQWFAYYVNQMLAKVPSDDPNRDRMTEALLKTRGMIEETADHRDPLISKL